MTGLRNFAGIVALVAAVACAVLLLLEPAIWREARPLPVLPVTAAADESHLPFGPVRPPRALPAISVGRHDGGQQKLPDLLLGHWTLLQLMFTGCSTTCPVQGAIFQQTEAQLGEMADEVKLLSVSIDPLGDTPATLDAWLKAYGAGPQWQAAVTPVDGLAPLLDVLNGRSGGADVDIHNARVFLISPGGTLVFITEEMPSPKSLIALLGDAIKSR